MTDKPIKSGEKSEGNLRVSNRSPGWYSGVDRNEIEWDSLGFESFKDLAKLSGLSAHERVGFPFGYREGKVAAIFDDIRSKLSHLVDRERVILDIGVGCGELANKLIAHCDSRNHYLHLVDSVEMLNQLHHTNKVRLWPGRFPDEHDQLLCELKGAVDVVIVYSVIQYVFRDSNIWQFFDSALSLLSSNGLLLIGDIPNTSMRARYFESEAGKISHDIYCQDHPGATLNLSSVQNGKMDDSSVFGLLQRARARGFNAWVLPQANGLPMANRREDILIHRP